MKSSACGHKLSCDLGTARIYEVYIVTQHACSYMILLAPFSGEMSISDLVSIEIKVVSLGLTRSQPHEAEPVYNRIVCEPFVYSDSHPSAYGIIFLQHTPAIPHNKMFCEGCLHTLPPHPMWNCSLLHTPILPPPHVELVRDTPPTIHI